MLAFWGWYVTGSEQRIVRLYKRVPNKPAYTAKHQSTWKYSYTNTLTPILILPAACTKRQTTFSIALEPQNQWLQKGPKLRKHGFGQARVRTGGYNRFAGLAVRAECPLLFGKGTVPTAARRVVIDRGPIQKHQAITAIQVWPIAGFLGS